MDELKGMDKLDVIFHMQNKFDSDLIKNRGLEGVKPEEWLKMQTLAVISELSELLTEVNFKWWKNPKEIDMSAVKEELIDILHFFVGMCLRTGMTSEELYEIYLKKNEENFKRQYGTSQKTGYELKESKSKKI